MAGITIAQLTGNGLFEKAKLSKEKQENALIEENATLDEYATKIEEVVGSREQITVDKAEYEQLLKDVADLKSSNGNNAYSTEEKVVGTWMDGKPLYRKCFKGTTGNSFKANLDNPDMVRVYGDVKEVNGNVINYFSIPYVNGGIYWTVYYDKTNDYVGLSANFSVAEFYITVEYTKTTDRATVVQYTSQ